MHNYFYKKLHDHFNDLSDSDELWIDGIFFTGNNTNSTEKGNNSGSNNESLNKSGNNLDKNT